MKKPKKKPAAVKKPAANKARAVKKGRALARRPKPARAATAPVRSSAFVQKVPKEIRNLVTACNTGSNAQVRATLKTLPKPVMKELLDGIDWQVEQGQKILSALKIVPGKPIGKGAGILFDWDVSGPVLIDHLQISDVLFDELRHLVLCCCWWCCCCDCWPPWRCWRPCRIRVYQDNLPTYVSANRLRFYGAQVTQPSAGSTEAIITIPGGASIPPHNIGDTNIHPNQLDIAQIPNAINKNLTINGVDITAANGQLQALRDGMNNSLHHHAKLSKHQVHFCSATNNDRPATTVVAGRPVITINTLAWPRDLAAADIVVVPYGYWIKDGTYNGPVLIDQITVTPDNLTGDVKIELSLLDNRLLVYESGDLTNWNNGSGGGTNYRLDLWVNIFA